MTSKKKQRNFQFSNITFFLSSTRKNSPTATESFQRVIGVIKARNLRPKIFFFVLFFIEKKWRENSLESKLLKVFFLFVFTLRILSISIAQLSLKMFFVFFYVSINFFILLFFHFFFGVWRKIFFTIFFISFFFCLRR